jgi:sugar O-acyltransferase (sialic acid O-acetyltransferase NeuD family)
MSALPIVVLGTGGHACVVVDALQISLLHIEGVVGPDPVVDVLGALYLGDDEILLARSPASVRLANGVGSVDAAGHRAKVFERFSALGFEFVVLVHPRAIIARDVLLGEGTQVMAGSVVQTGAILGRNVIVNTQASVDHDCEIGDHVHIAPGATLSGGVVVGAGAHVGAGAVILQGRMIGARAVVGAGAVVDRDVREARIVVGVPARERVRE